MARTETTAHDYACDHGKCDKVHTVRAGARPPGIVLTVDVMRPGATAHEPARAAVYACGRTHVGPAVLAVLDAAADGLNTVTYVDQPDSERDDAHRFGIVDTDAR